REFKAPNPQGGTAIGIWAKGELGKAKVEFLQNDKVLSTMDVDIKEGMNRFQWNMLGPAPPASANAGRGGRGGRGGGPVPFVTGGGRGGGGGFFGFGVPQGQPGAAWHLLRAADGGR